MRVCAINRDSLDALISMVVVPDVCGETWEAGLLKWRAWDFAS